MFSDKRTLSINRLYVRLRDLLRYVLCALKEHD